MATRRNVFAGILAAGLAAAVSGQVKSATGLMALTPLDYVEIRQLVNRYAFAVDTGSSNGYDYADLFAADGEFMRPYAKGREQLAALARGARLGPNNTVHYIMNHAIAPAPGVAGRGGAGGPVNGWDLIGRKAGELARTGGHYEDAYVKTPVGWRF